MQLSIIIPTYNGGKTISRTLNNICSQISASFLEREIEIVVTDDCSTDNTVSIVTDLKSTHKFIKIFKNKVNLGMDKNFIKAIENSSGEYVWFFGQDDQLLEGGIEFVRRVLHTHKNIQNIYLDYVQYDEGKDKIVCGSMIDTQSKKRIDDEISVINNQEDYFNLMSDGSSFLPATIVRVNKRLLSILEPYIGTYYIQYAYFLYGLKLGKTILVRKQLIKGLIPSNGWQKNGSMLFGTTVGKLWCQHQLNQDDSDVFPDKLLNDKKHFFIMNYIGLILTSVTYGLEITHALDSKLSIIFTKSGERLYMRFINKLIRQTSATRYLSIKMTPLILKIKDVLS